LAISSDDNKNDIERVTREEIGFADELLKPYLLLQRKVFEQGTQKDGYRKDDHQELL